MQPFSTDYIHLAGEHTFTYNVDGTLSTITKVLPGGYTFVKTYTYTNSRITNISEWELQ